MSVDPNEPSADKPEATADGNQHVSPPSQSQSSRRRRALLREIISTAVVLVLVVVLAFGLISFVFQSYQVSGPSMQTTLHNGNHLIVWKVPRTWARITGHPYVPQRGDIIVFNEPGLNIDGSDNPQLIKRVIGLPGDRVVVRNGTITIYNKAHPNGFNPDKTLPYHKAIGYTAGDLDITLNQNQIFVCGDNRSDSTDSRVFGPIELNNIVGKLALRVTPFSQAQVF